MKNNVFLLCNGLLAAFTLSANAQKPKNILFILADDLGWNDVTLYGNNSFYETPNIERLASRGVVFTNAYSASPLSSPTRASILTGQTTARHGVTAPQCHEPKARLKAGVALKSGPLNKSIESISANRLSTDLPTLAKLLKAEGYSTAHFGKWHLGPEPFSPLQHGFDIDIPHWPGPGPAGSFVAPWKFPTFKENYPNEHIEDRMAEEAIAWLRNRDKTKPFYMNYWQFSVHAPFDAKEEVIDKYRKKIDFSNPQHSPTYAAMVEAMDDAVGKLLDEIDRQGIADETIIVFFSDNGGNMYNGIRETDANGKSFIAVPTSNAPLRGGKATMYEGGVRVPCVVVWPGLSKSGLVSDVRLQATDFYPTFLENLGISIPKGHVIDGVNFSSALQGEKYDRKPMFTYFPHGPKVPDWMPASISVHWQDWKLIRIFNYGLNGNHAYRLYNIKNDISERTDLASFYPEKVAELDKMIEDFLNDTKVPHPVANPAFQVEKYKPEQIGIQAGGLKIQPLKKKN